MNGYYRIADQDIEIDSIYGDVQEYCAGYRVDECVPDFIARMTPEDLEREAAKVKRLAEYRGHRPGPTSPAFLEVLAVYRKLAEWLPERETFLMHGSCVAVDGVGYLFTARSGTGKSTHTGLWRQLLGERAVMVNDDKPLLKVAQDGSVTAYGTPWCGKHRIGNRIAVPLKAICVLERSEENRIQEITRGEAYPMLLQQAYRPDSREALEKTVGLIERMNVAYYRLGCNMDIGAAELAYHTMKL